MPRLDYYTKESHDSIQMVRLFSVKCGSNVRPYTTRNPVDREQSTRTQERQVSEQSAVSHWLFSTHRVSRCTGMDVNNTFFFFASLELLHVTRYCLHINVENAINQPQ